MVTCKDCIGNKFCSDYEKYDDVLLKTIGEERGVEDLCANFIPSTDFVPVRRGQWELHDDGSGTCDQCGTRQLHIWDFDNWQNFCGHCGADMRGESYDTM